MGFFEEVTEIEQAFAKIGILGFQGSGKTYTGVLIATGLNELLGNKKPVFFVDTETGSDYRLRHFTERKVRLFRTKNRAFKNLIPICQEAASMSDVLVVDSITAFWDDLIASYKKKKNRNFISFSDWGTLKQEWKRFTDWYVNSPIHCIICGRAGFIYNEYTDEEGKEHLEKTGTKMKAENEFGYEPSLLIEMERVKVPDPTTKVGQKVLHVAHVLKDRFDVLDGQTFTNPTFETFRPIIELLNIGGKHIGVETESSEEMFAENGSTEWRKKEEQRQVAYEEFAGLMTENFPASTGVDKVAKQRLCQVLFGTTSGTAIQKLPKEDYERAKKQAESILENSAYVEILMSKERNVDLGQIKIETEQPAPETESVS